MAEYDGLFCVPATDPNFQSGLERLDTPDLKKMLDHMEYLTDQGEHHKGRIKAVEKELALRGDAAETKRGRKAKTGENSREIVAMDKFQADIETAERLYADGMPYELDRIENEIKFYMAQTAQALFESGKRFLRIRAHEDHGAFYAALERIGVPERTADYAMAVVKKFGPNPLPVADLGSTKLKMLTVFEDEEIKEYVNGGPLGSIPHDDVEKMSKRELQAAIRKERNGRDEDRKSSDKAIFIKEKKISELEAQLRYQEPPTQEQIARAALQELTL